VHGRIAAAHAPQHRDHCHIRQSLAVLSALEHKMLGRISSRVHVLKDP
jgi:hypothetical protein